MEFGKIITHDSYHNGQRKSHKIEYSIPVIAQDKTQVMTEIIKGLELITSKKTSKLIIEIAADPKTFSFKMVTKNYITDEN